MTADPGDLNVTGMIDATPLIPVGTLVNVTDGPHKGKRGRIRSASGDGHVLLDTPGEKSPIRVHTGHLEHAGGTSRAADATIRAMAGRKPKQ